MQPISHQDYVHSSKVASEIFQKYRISEEDQNSLYNALATVGIWNITQKKE